MRSILLMAWLMLAPTSAWAAPCEAWPGEPDPLPSLQDPSPVRAEWAALRARELALAAAEFETRDRLRARQLWRRVLCLDPGNDDALAGVLRTPPVRVFRPSFVDEPFEARPGGDAYASLGAPLGLRRPHPVTRPDAVRSELLALEGSLTSLADLVAAARFEAALEAADPLRRRLAQAPEGEARRRMLVETEVLSATAELALDRPGDAMSSFWRALDADPELVLDPLTTSPKVVRALESAREARTP